MIYQLIGAFVSTIAFSVVFNVAKRELVFCGVTGAIGWLVYLLMFHANNEVVFASFMATAVVSVISQILARVRKNPVTVFQISGIFPLVPGLGMYRTLYYVVSENYDLASEYLFQTIQIAGSIAVGMVLVSSLNKVIIKRNRVEAAALRGANK